MAVTKIYDMFFFFQAEDVIRDLTVTGVQTCALPISESFDQGDSSMMDWLYALPVVWMGAIVVVGIGASSLLIHVVVFRFAERGWTPAFKAISRSEERRVGKECRSRWSTRDFNIRVHA